MDDKMFELIEKMYSDLTSRMDSMEKNMATRDKVSLSQRGQAPLAN